MSGDFSSNSFVKTEFLEMSLRRSSIDFPFLERISMYTLNYYNNLC